MHYSTPLRKELLLELKELIEEHAVSQWIPIAYVVKVQWQNYHMAFTLLLSIANKSEILEISQNAPTLLARPNGAGPAVACLGSMLQCDAS